ncbi:sensor histidine kinase [Actinopolyspora saharensis]|uniref:sensor histidine kinase n=1 Tax=Actinopolyspora saharensis TaxID=995062 RepID=UPI003F6793CE
MIKIETVPAESKVHRMRLYTWWSLALMSSIALVSAFAGLARADWTGHGWILMLAAVGTTVQRTRFVNQAMHESERRSKLKAEYSISAVAAIALWSYGAAVCPHPLLWAPLPALVAGAVVVNLSTRARWNATAVSILLTGAAGAAALPLGQVDGLGPVLLSVIGMGFVGIFVLIDVAHMWLWVMVVEVDRSRETAGKLAVAHERLRFASDLHDIQGHHLQAIVLKGELTERLVGHDDETARSHAAEVTELAREALTHTREMVHGYRNTDLQTEITNAMDLLRAAGINTNMRGSVSSIPPPLQQLFGTLVREGTTNVLRHSRAQHCNIVLSVKSGQAAVQISNDGANPSRSDGNGITSLRERFATLGGHVAAGTRGDGQFEIIGQAPAAVRSNL